MKTYVLLLSFSFFSLGSFMACGTKSKQTNKTVNTSAKESLPTLTWQKMDQSKIGREAGGRKVPFKYQAFLIDKEELSRYFEGFRNSSYSNYFFRVPMPAEVGTLSFPLKKAQTMNEELERKYPNLLSMSGHLSESDLRLNYDGEKMSGLIQHKGASYLLEPWQIDGQTVYLLYNRNDAAEKKVPFEHGER